MGRKKKLNIEVNSSGSMQDLMQEVYNNSCNQINEAQKIINEVTVKGTAEDVDDVAKLAKAKTDALKIKDSAIKVKLEVGKLQNDIIKHNGNSSEILNSSPDVASLEGMEKIRKLIEDNRDSKN